MNSVFERTGYPFPRLGLEISPIPRARLGHVGIPNGRNRRSRVTIILSDYNRRTWTVLDLVSRAVWPLHSPQPDAARP